MDTILTANTSAAAQYQSQVLLFCIIIAVKSGYEVVRHQSDWLSGRPSDLLTRKKALPYTDRTPVSS